MVYETFVNEITRSLQALLGSEGTAEIRRVTKNNGILLTGLSIFRHDEPVSPTIYLESYYEQYQRGEQLETIIQSIWETCRLVPEPLLENVRQIRDFEKVRDKIIFRLIHASSNLSLLREVPFLPYLDLAIVFSVALEGHSCGLYSTLVRREQLDDWHISIDTLMDCARENTPRLFPPCLHPMRDIIRDFARQNWGNEFNAEVIDGLLDHRDLESPLYVLSNTACINGASCILYDNIIKNFADALESDVVLLPSSIHEVLLSPVNEDCCFDELSNMVTEINQSDVPPEDRLSNQVYLYSRASDHISIVSNAPEQLTS